MCFLVQYETKSDKFGKQKQGKIAKKGKNFYIDYVHTIGLQENITIWLYHNITDRIHDKHTKNTSRR